MLSHSLFSTESIVHQTNTQFFQELTGVCQFLRDELTPYMNRATIDQVVTASGLVKIILKHTNITINPIVTQEIGYNAAVLVPALDLNHPIDTRSIGAWPQAEKELHTKVLNRLQRDRKELLGKVNLETGKVDGVYTRIKITMYLGPALVLDDAMTVGSVAAIILHEIGHIMTYFEYLGKTMTLNHVLHDVGRAIAEITERERRVELIRESFSNLAINDDPEALADVRKQSVFEQYVLASYVGQLHSLSNSPMYDVATWEALSDQYATRMGAGRDLAVGLDTLWRRHGIDIKQNVVWYLILQTLTVSYWTVFSIVVFPLAPLVILSSYVLSMGDAYDTYDKSAYRIKRVRNDIVDRLKNPNLTKELRVQYQDDIAMIDKILKGAIDRRTFMQAFWQTIIPSVRQQVKRKAALQQLETLANNELFVKANQFELMTNKG